MAFYDELRQRGYVEGQNLIVERRNAAGQPDQLPALARELVALRPDLIVASSPQPNRAVKDATSTIPIVMIAVGDPVRAGLVASLARPGGNLTGVAAVVPGGFMAKMLELLHQAVPKATRIAMLINPTNEMHRILVPLEIPEAARRLGVQIQIIEARTADEIEPALNAAVGERAEALFIQGDPVFNNPPERLPQLVARTGSPRIYLFRTQVQAGGLMSYGPDYCRNCSRRAASLRRPHPQRCETRRPGDRAADEVRAGHQPQDREGARPHDPAVAAAARGRGDSMIAVRIWITVHALDVLPPFSAAPASFADRLLSKTANGR